MNLQINKIYIYNIKLKYMKNNNKKKKTFSFPYSYIYIYIRIFENTWGEIKWSDKMYKNCFLLKNIKLFFKTIFNFTSKFKGKEKWI